MRNKCVIFLEKYTFPGKKTISWHFYLFYIRVIPNSIRITRMSVIRCSKIGPFLADFESRHFDWLRKIEVQKSALKWAKLACCAGFGLILGVIFGSILGKIDRPTLAITVEVFGILPKSGVICRGLQGKILGFWENSLDFTQNPSDLSTVSPTYVLS